MIPLQIHWQRLVFIGSIKDDDIKNYPPYGIVKSKVLVNHLGQRLLPKQNGTSYNQKARKGFKYWYKEPKKNIMGKRIVINK